MPGERDDIVLWIAIAFCLLTPVVLVFIWAYDGKFIPPMILSVLLGIAVAALTYRYLGGTQGTQFSVGALKLAGSAALLLGTAYLTNDGLSKQMDSENSVVRLHEANGKIKKLENTLDQKNSEHKAELEKLKSDVQTKHGTILSLEKQLIIAMQNQGVVNIVEIEKLTPTSPLGEQILALQKKKKGPFRETAYVKEGIRVTVSGDIDKKGLFFACSFLDLAEENVKLTRINSENTGVYTVIAKQAGRMDLTYCSSDKRKFEMQLHCDDGRALFPDQIDNCRPDGSVGWKIAGGERYFSVDVAVLSE